MGARVSVVCHGPDEICNVLVFGGDNSIETRIQNITCIFIQYVYDFHCLRL